MADDISRVRRSRKALGIRWLYGQRMGAGRVGTRNQVYHRSRNRVDLATLLGRGRKNQFLGKVLRPVWRYRFPRCFARWLRRGLAGRLPRSEERRVGKEWRCVRVGEAQIRVVE